jgi:hypothetical protein
MFVVKFLRVALAALAFPAGRAKSVISAARSVGSTAAVNSRDAVDVDMAPLSRSDLRGRQGQRW